MSGSCTPDSHSRPHHSAYPPVCHREITQRSHACPIEDSGYPQPRGPIYAHPVTAPQAPTATDMAVHWWQVAGNSTDPADLALLAPRERARPNRPQHPPHATEFTGSRTRLRRVATGPPERCRTPSRRSGHPAAAEGAATTGHLRCRTRPAPSGPASRTSPAAARRQPHGPRWEGTPRPDAHRGATNRHATPAPRPGPVAVAAGPPGTPTTWAFTM